MARPHVILKLATSLDGRIATAAGESRWITGELARQQVHMMRAQVSAVMIGAGTARADNPSLTARTEPPPAKQPTRIVVTTRLELDPESALFDGAAPLLVFSAERAGPARQAIFEAMGVRIEQVARDGEGVDVGAVLDRLGALGFDDVLVEGGGKLAASLIAANAVDQLEWFRAPILLGAEGRPAVAALSYAGLAGAPKWRRLAAATLGPDLWESYERA